MRSRIAQIFSHSQSSTIPCKSNFTSLEYGITLARTRRSREAIGNRPSKEPVPRLPSNDLHLSFHLAFYLGPFFLLHANRWKHARARARSQASRREADRHASTHARINVDALDDYLGHAHRPSLDGVAHDD